MTPTTAYETRAEATHHALKVALEQKLRTFEGGELDGVQFITNADMLDVFAEPLPEPNERAAEVTTPSRVSVLGLCPLCGQGSYLAVHLTPILTIETTGRMLKLQVKTKGVNHNCGQVTLPEGGVAGQSSFELDDIVRSEEALTDDERDSGETSDAISDDDTGPLLEDAEGDISEAEAWDSTLPSLEDEGDGDLLPD